MAPRGLEPIAPLPPASTGLPGQSAEPMTLDKMIALVGERDPRVVVNELSARAAYERSAKAWAGHYPQLSVEYAMGREGNWNAQGSGSTSASSINADNFHGGQVNVSWELFAWGATQKRYQEAYALAQAEEDRYRRAWDLIVMEAISNYINMYRLRKQLEITRQTLLGHSKLLKVVEDRVGAKLAPESRRSDALLRVQEVMADREDILSQLDEVNTTYRTLTGLGPPVELDEPRIASEYETRLACLSMDDNLRLAYSVHPQILANLRTIEAASYAVEGMKAERLPKFNLYARYNNNRLFSTQGSTLPFTGRGYEVGVNVIWTLFGSAYGNSIAERIFLKEKSEADNERAIREVERNIHIARDAMAAAKGRTAILSETLRLSEDVLNQRQRSFAVQTMSDEAVNGLSNAYYSRARAATALLNLRMREVVASYTLVESSGLMNEVFPAPLSMRGPIGPVPVRNFFAGKTAGMNPVDGMPSERNVMPDLLTRKVVFAGGSPALGESSESARQNPPLPLRDAANGDTQSVGKTLSLSSVVPVPVRTDWEPSAASTRSLEAPPAMSATDSAAITGAATNPDTATAQ
ncbi:TolC family protein [Burkholderia ubonensis]|uniref:TolC family protein n=1 Tax=Burkholderia ubonensis TaxID=101571 RepID=UPI00358FA033